MTSIDSQSKTTGTVLCQDHGNGIYSLQIDAVADQPVLSEAIQQTLLNQLALVQSHADLKVLILQGGEQTFLRGDRNHVNQAITSKLLATLSEFPYPVIAAVEGHATGAGWLVASLCDFMVLNQDSDYGYSVDELFPSPAEQQMFEHRFGYQQATDLLFQTPLMRGAELKAKSWTCAIVDKKQVHTHAHKLAENLAKKPQTALRLLKQHLGRQQFALTQQLNPVDAIAEPTPAKKVKLSSPSKNIALHTEQEHVLTVHIQQAKRSYAVKTLLADLTKLARQINKAPHYKVVILQSDYAEFFSEDSEKIQVNQVLALQQWIQSIERPVVCLLNSDSQGKAWLMSQVCDSVIYQQQGSYSLAGVLHDPQLAQPTSALLTYHYGQVVGRELVLSGGVVTGAELQQRCPSVLVANSDQEASTKAQQLAAFLAEYPLAELQAWKQHRVTCLTTLISNLPNWQAGAEAPSDGQVTEVTDIALNTQVIKAKAHPQGIIEVRMEDREAKNMFSEAFTDGMSEVFQHIEANPQYKVVVLTGYDKYFASGGTKAALLAIQDGQTQFTDNKVFQSTWACSIPVIAAMQGHGVGGGLTLGLFSDIALLSEESKYFSPYMQYGFTPGAGANFVTPNMFGLDLAKESLLLAVENSGSELQQRGVSLRVLPRDQIRDNALAIAQQIADRPRSVLTALKNQWQQQTQDHIEENYQHELDMHQKTFVGQTETRSQITDLFNEADKATSTTNLEPTSQRQETSQTVGKIYSLTDITDALKHMLAEELHMHANDVDEDAQFVDLGLDSITSVTWMRKINETYGLNIEATKVYSQSTLNKMSRYVTDEINSHSSLSKIDTAQIAQAKSNTPISSPRHEAIQEPVKTGMIMCSTDETLNSVKDSLRILLADELHMRAADVDDDAQFVDLGLDSITSVTWMRKINEKYGLNIEATKVYSQSTLNKMGQFVFSELGENIAATETETPALESHTLYSPDQSTSISAPEKTDTQVRQILKDLLANELHMAANDIDEDAQFVDLGLDSITSVTWMRKINEQYGLNIEATKVYSQSTLNKMSEFVQSQLLSAQPSHLAVEKSTVAQSVVTSKVELTKPESTSNSVNLSATTPVRPKLTSKKPKTSAEESHSRRNTSQPEPIAVIGMAGQFPKSANINEYWQNIIDGKNCISEIPKSRWDISKYYQEENAGPGQTNCIYMGLLDDHDAFDPLFFDISPKEALSMDPQQRVLMQTCWQAFEHAGYTPKTLAGSKCGVFVGCGPGDYHLLKRELQISALGFTGGDTAIMAARVAYFFDLQGPCLTIETACSSSLVAMAYACDSLNSGASNMAIAGGVYVSSGPDMHIKTTQTGMLSKDGKCYTFDKRANGFVPGEGVGSVILKRLSDAERDGDIIHGVIEGWGVNQDGKTNGITAPNPDSQTRLQQEVYDNFNIDPASIQLIEAHGTGTKLGDPIEVDALKETFKKYTKKQGYCALGSVKSNIGHCFTAAGVASSIKVLLALKNRQLPPTINFENINEHINLNASPFYVSEKGQDWTLGDAEKRQAAISGFGFGGTNAHLVISEYVPSMVNEPGKPLILENGKTILPLSARTPEQLQQKASDLFDYLCENAHYHNLFDIAYTLQTCRAPMEERLAIMAGSVAELSEKLRSFIYGENNDVYLGQVSNNKETLSILRQDNEMKETVIGKWISQGKLSKIADLWSKGLEFDWSQLYGQLKPRKVTLPNYPFAKERYWITKVEQSSVAGIDRESAPDSIEYRSEIIHPLLHKNTSNLDGLRYTTYLNCAEDYLAASEINGLKVLPAAAYLEMVRAAVVDASANADGKVVTVSDVSWGQPIILEGAKEVSISLYHHHDNSVEFEIYSQQEGGEVVHCQGVARCISNASVLTFDVEQIKRQLAGGDIGQALVQLDVSRFVKGSFARYQLCPCAIDQVMRAETTIAGTVSGLGQFTLPLSIQNIKIFHQFAQHSLAWIRSSSNGAFDIDFADEQGNICVQITGLTLQQAYLGLSQPQSDTTASSSVVAVEKTESAVAAITLAQVQSELKTSLAKALYMDSDKIHADKPFTDLGLDSIVGVEWVNELKKQYGIALPATIVYDYPNLKDFSHYIHSILSTNTSSVNVPPVKVETPTPQPESVSLSVSSDQLIHELKESLATALYMSVESIRIDKPFIELGLDSIIGVEWVNALKKQYGLSLPATVVYDYPNIVEFARYLADQLKTDMPVVLESKPVLANSISIVTPAKTQTATIISLKELQQELKESLANALYMEPSAIALDKPFIELGLDSIVGVEWINVLKKQYALALPATIVYDYPSIVQFADYLHGQISTSSAVVELPKAPLPLSNYSAAPITASNPQSTATSRVNAGRDLITLQQELKESLAKALYLPNANIALDKPFIELGLDSIIGVEWVNEIKKQYAIELPATIVYDYPTIKTFSEYLKNIIPAELAASEQATTVSPDSVHANTQKVSVVATSNSSFSLEQLKQELKESLAKALYMNVTDVQVDKPFIELGLDSIVGVEWVNELKKHYRLQLPATIVYDYPNINLFASFIAEQIGTTNTVSEPVSAINTQTPLSTPETSTATALQGSSQFSPVPNLLVDSYPSLIRKARKPVKHYKTEATVSSGKIAIVGMSGRYPQANNMDQFWENLVSGKNSITEVPSDRWDVNEYYDPDPKKEGKVYCKWLGAVDDIDCFDPLFFKISPAEAKTMDPQQRLFLEESFKTFEDAGYSSQSLNGKKCGVYTAIIGNEYAGVVARSNAMSADITGNNLAIGAARIAYFLNLKGPAITVDTACSSSLVAIHLACQGLRTGETDMALAGGASVYLEPELYMGMCKAGMLSPAGQCKTFDNSADGFVPGEGVGVVLLKRLEDAERDNDTIYGVILGSGINQDGKTNGITAPSVNSQMALERELYEKCNVHPESISYIETHGTGTKLGDPIELEALSAVFKEKTDKKNFCGLGSVKSNVGHTSGAAGVCSVQKVVLSMVNQKLVPSLNVQKENTLFDFKSSPFYVSKNTQDWQVVNGEKRRASVNSFGFSGTNAHVVIEEYIKPQATKSAAHFNRDIPIVVSARTSEQLTQRAKALYDYLDNNHSAQQLALEDIAYTLLDGRDAMDERLAFIVRSKKDICIKLNTFLNGHVDSAIFRSRVEKDADGMIVIQQQSNIKEVVEQYVHNHQFANIAEMWVKGLDLSWGEIYSGELPHRVSLPTYPFARKRYWVEPANNKTTVSYGGGDSKSTAILHPLVHENISILEQLCFRSRFNGSESFFVTFEANKALTGVAFIEMAREAIERAMGIPKQDKLIEIHSVSWGAPLTVAHMAQVNIAIIPNNSNTLAFEVYSLLHGNNDQYEEIIHCQGHAVVGDKLRNTSLDINRIQSRVKGRDISLNTLYQKIDATNRSQLIQSATLGQDQLLLEINTQGQQDKHCVVDPFVLDHILQASMLLLDGSRVQFKSVSLPFSIQSVHIQSELAQHLYAWIRFSDGYQLPTEMDKTTTVQLDIDVFDIRGKLCVEMKGIGLETEMHVQDNIQPNSKKPVVKPQQAVTQNIAVSSSVTKNVSTEKTAASKKTKPNDIQLNTSTDVLPKAGSNHKPSVSLGSTANASISNGVENNNTVRSKPNISLATMSSPGNTLEIESKDKQVKDSNNLTKPAISLSSPGTGADPNSVNKNSAGQTVPTAKPTISLAQSNTTSAVKSNTPPKRNTIVLEPAGE
ncbi:beta-ketoacyl synthase N-terminal-like domain-containing protein [Teredinibacter sp. KSP-S5-2]|uniref:beta-ketoacyl synthase N-terminal-like domain-containing protein n=1 Tax=Teredinibacter sp. KSP-S5-2 TaxID=3034506 RepID=UPI002935014C|nr:beta-ketoacyl synthase N-terminal-like domain-containing protein [Teredinibacter sp. KSP-S5-2]WNO11561.1 beta-ketoacyl synthase N-terminal-like domain-containing protein [Teredinibacter sp. KSP-S5-2]